MRKLKWRVKPVRSRSVSGSADQSSQNVNAATNHVGTSVLLVTLFRPLLHLLACPCLCCVCFEDGNLWAPTGPNTMDTDTNTSYSSSINDSDAVAPLEPFSHAIRTSVSSISQRLPDLKALADLKLLPSLKDDGTTHLSPGDSLGCTTTEREGLKCRSKTWQKGYNVYTKEVCRNDDYPLCEDITPTSESAGADSLMKPFWIEVLPPNVFSTLMPTTEQLMRLKNSFDGFLAPQNSNA